MTRYPRALSGFGENIVFIHQGTLCTLSAIILLLSYKGQYYFEAEGTGQHPLGLTKAE